MPPKTRSQIKKKSKSPWKSSFSDQDSSTPVKQSDKSHNEDNYTANHTSTMSTSSTVADRPKLPDLVFKGTKYGPWRQRIQNLLIREGYLDLLSENKAETEYINDPQCETKQAELLLRQEKAKGLIFDNLDTRQFEKVSGCITVRQVLEKLDSEFKVTSQIGLITAREEYHSFKFNLKGEMSKFLEIFDSKCQNFIDAGGK